MSATTTRPDAAAATDRQELLAFVADAPTRAAIEQAAGDTISLATAVQRGTIREAIAHLGERRSPRVLIVDLGNSEMPISAINELAEVCEPGVAVIAVGERNDVGLFRDLLANGVLDYIVKPVTPNLVQRALSLALDGQRSAGRGTRPGKMILVEGVRGGVGATMVATGVAWSLAHTRRRRTVLLDFDFTFGSVALALDLDPSRELRHALENPGRLDGLYVERLLTRVSDTLCVLSAEENPEEPLDVDPAALELLLDELRAKFHYVVVDLPRSSSRTHQQLAGGPATAILVTDLSLAGMRDTLRMIESVKAGNEAAQIIVVANRIGEHRQGEISTAEFEKAIGRGVDIRIPFDSRSVAAAMNAGKPVCARPGEVARALEALAEKASGAAQRPSRNPLRRLAALWTRS